jgi:photosystem II stability/assembly factor-like uncharacterized protein
MPATTLRTYAILTFFLCYIFSGLQAQSYKDLMNDPSVNFYDVCRAAEDYFKTHDKNQRGSGWNEYMRWRRLNECFFYPDGDRSKTDFQLVTKAYRALLAARGASDREAPGDWIDLGPYSANNITEGYNPGIGRVETFWVSPDNANLIYMGSRSGGFWRSNNGGQTWLCTTDTLVATGVNTLSVSPGNPNDILINVRNANNGTSHGIYRSTDGGFTWTPTAFGPGSGAFGGLGTNNQVNMIKFHPGNAGWVFVGTNQGIFRSTNNLQSWTQLYSNGNITDISFHPTDPNRIYLFNNASSADRNRILISQDGGLNYTQSNTIQNNNDARGRIDVTPLAPDNVYFASNNGVWKSTDKGQNFSFLSAPQNTCQGFAVSDVDPENMIYGYVNIEASFDGGNSFFEVTAWANTQPDETYTHADLRYADCVNGTFYVGTDGYLCKSEDFGLSWTRLNDGTGIREFYKGGVCQSDDRVHMVGSQDNGTSICNADGWIEWNGGDGMEAIIYPLNPDVMIGSWQYGTRNRTIDGGISRDGINTPESGSDEADWIAPLLLDPARHTNIYHFSSNVHTTDGFGSPIGWQMVGTPNIGIIQNAAIAENNSDLIIASRNGSLSLSTNNYTITDLAFDPLDDSTIIVTFGRFQNDGQKIFLSRNLGQSWENITGNLNAMPIRAVRIDHTPQKNIYVGGEIGLYTKPLNSADNTWQLYNTGLPNTTVREIEIHYGANLLKAITWGRGLWERPLVGRASYPAIVKTRTTDPIPYDEPVARNSPQNIFANIQYNGALSEVYVEWSLEKGNLTNRINMTQQGNEWVSVTPIPAQDPYLDIFFRVVAIGNAQDTSVTYTFMYQQGPCLPKSENLTVQSCGPYSLGGSVYAASGFYQNAVIDNTGCPLTQNLSLTVTPESNLNIVQNGNVLTAQQNGAQYQWLNCNNNYAVIPGATGISYTAPVSGAYALRIQRGACQDTTNCIQVTVTDVQTPTLAELLSIQPNPSSGDFHVRFAPGLAMARLEVFTADGKRVTHRQIPENQGMLLELEAPPGVYFLQVSDETGRSAMLELVLVEKP